MSPQKLENQSFDEKIRIGLSYLIPIGLLLTLLIVGAEFFLLIFASLLFAVFLNTFIEKFQKYLKLNRSLSLLLTLLLLLGLVSLFVYFVYPHIGDQFQRLSSDIQNALHTLRDKYLSASSGPLAEALDQLGAQRLFQGGRELLSKTAGLVSGTLGALANVLIIFFAGVFFAANPAVYRKGLLALIPKSRCEEFALFLSQAHHQLENWLLGKILGMLVVAVLTGIGLAFLDMPLVTTLAVIAGTFSFIPNIGPIISAVPAILVGFTESPSMALYVALLYIGVQTLESYLITPFIQRSMTSLPPALILGVQVLLGIFYGILGLALAVPLALVVVLAIQRFYVEDHLHKHSFQQA